ncbi:MAG: HIT domain-containing protein [Candidatus Saccharimonadales bacterium]
MNNCPFCNFALLEAAFVHEYNHWNLFLQSADKRRKTKGAAGFLATKEHVETPEITTNESWLEVKGIIRDASERLCLAAGMTYRGAETVGFNQGKDAGQTVNHAHIHILPATEEDPVELRCRGGIGGAFEELRRNRLKS